MPGVGWPRFGVILGIGSPAKRSEGRRGAGEVCPLRRLVRRHGNAMAAPSVFLLAVSGEIESGEVREAPGHHGNTLGHHGNTRRDGGIALSPVRAAPAERPGFGLGAASARAG